jgi:hypothetical protein
MTKFAFIILISLILKEYIALEVIYRKSIQDNFQSNKDFNGRLARPLWRATAKHGHDYSCNPSFTNFLFLCAGVIIRKNLPTLSPSIFTALYKPLGKTVLCGMLIR